MTDCGWQRCGHRLQKSKQRWGKKSRRFTGTRFLCSMLVFSMNPLVAMVPFKNVQEYPKLTF